MGKFIFLQLFRKRDACNRLGRSAKIRPAVMIWGWRRRCWLFEFRTFS